MTEQKLNSGALVGAAREIEARREAIDDYKIQFSQTYGQVNGNLLKEVLEQRAIAREATEYADALIKSADLPDEED